MLTNDKDTPLSTSIKDGGGHENKLEIIALKKWRFLDDRPIIQGMDDIIWQKGDVEIWEQLESIAEQITASVEDNTSPASGMVFGVFGDWGAGKSSFLQMLEGKVSEIATNKGKSDSIVFSTYVASAYAYSNVSVRKTLALQLVNGLEKKGLAICSQLGWEPSQAVSHFAETLAGLEETEKAIDKLMALKEFPVLISKVFSGETEISNNRPLVMVYFIDDLDRCPLDIVERVLQTTHEWADVRNLFFVLAINRNWLLKAVKKLVHVADEPDYALEKYIQHSITLGNLNGKALVSYVKNLLERYEGDISRCIVENIVYLQKGLIHSTPRAIKRLLNAIHPKLNSKLEREKFQANGEGLRRVIKTEVLAYSWPSFYQDYFLTSVQGKNQGLANRWKQLEAACRDYEEVARRDGLDPDKVKLEFSLSRLQETYKDEQFMNPVDYRLVSFLSEPPYWLYIPRESDIGDLGDAIPPPAANAFRFEKSDLTPMAEENIDVQFMQLYYSGQNETDPKKKLEYFFSAAELASKYQTRIPKHRADEIGNMAVDAENLRSFKFAEDLYQFALALQPDHPNNMQNYASFICDTQQEASYQEAEQLLKKVKENHADFKPERTLALTVQLAGLHGELLVPSEQQIEVIFAKLRNSPTDYSVYRNAMMLAVRIHNFEMAQGLLKIACDKAVVDSPEYLYERLRFFADAITSQRDFAEKRLQAVEIYRRILNLKETFNISSTDEADILHNYATLLYRFDYDDQAGEVWYQAYSLAPSDPSIQAAYSNYVSKINRPDVLTKIMAREALTESEKVLLPQNKPMPSSFSDEPYIDEIFRVISDL